MKTAAIYARVSTADQIKGTSLDGQVDNCTEFATEHGYTALEAIREDYSGARLQRPGLDRVRDMAAKGEVQAVIVFDPDRLTRNLAHLMLLDEEFERGRVSLLFVNSPRENTPEGKMLFGMKGLFAEYERAKIMERTRRGKERRLREGRIMMPFNAVPYGYNVVKDLAALEINPLQAPWVASMYEWVVFDHYTLGDIVRKLEESGVPTPQGKVCWQRSTAQRILANPVNMGEWFYGKRESVLPRKPRFAKNANKKWSKQWKPREGWIKVQVPAIVTPDIYHAAQVQLGKNRDSRGNHAKHYYLLGSMLTCGHCGYKMSGTARKREHRIATYYRCAARYQHQRALPMEERCHAPSWDAKLIEDVLWREVVKQLSDPDLIAATLQGRTDAILKERRRDDEEYASLLAAEEKLKREVDTLLDLHVSGIISREVLQERMALVQTKRGATAKAKAEVQERIKRREDAQGTLESVRTLCEKARAGLQYLTIEERREFYETMNVQISIKDGIMYVTGLITDAVLGIVDKDAEHNGDRCTTYPHGYYTATPLRIPFALELALTA